MKTVVFVLLALVLAALFFPTVVTAGMLTVASILALTAAYWFISIPVLLLLLYWVA